jgi:DNA gyrase/topoisomerase IV subunit B
MGDLITNGHLVPGPTAVVQIARPQIVQYVYSDEEKDSVLAKLQAKNESLQRTRFG